MEVACRMAHALRSLAHRFADLSENLLFFWRAFCQPTSDRNGLPSASGGVFSPVSTRLEVAHMTLPTNWKMGSNVRFADIRKRMETATLPEKYELLTFVRVHSARIRPRVSDRWLMSEMVGYLLECAARQPDSDADPDDEDFDSPFDAAGQLVRWFDWYRTSEKDSAKVQAIADRIADCYRNGDDRTRNCVETGFLEHALETPENRPFFQSWADDPQLANALRESMRWGLAHEPKDEG